MVKKTATVEELSSAELFELARRREEEERREQEEARKEKIKELRAEKRKMLARHRRELAALENEIAKLQGKAPARAGGRRSGAAEAVLEIIRNSGPITTTDIRQALNKKGVVVGNLPQTLAYLKRQGRVTSPARATYEATK